MNTRVNNRALTLFLSSTCVVLVVYCCCSTGGIFSLSAKLNNIGECWTTGRKLPAVTTTTPAAGQTEPVSDKPCTHALLRQFYAKYKRLPGDGVWVDEDGRLYFQPSICKFRYDLTLNSGERLRRCLHASNVSHVVTIGDSNGGRHYVMLHEAFRSFGRRTCQTVDAERPGGEGGFLPDGDYFASSEGNWTEFVRVHYRFCKTCRSSRRRCAVSYDNQTRAVLLQHVAMTMIVDDSVQLHVPEFRRGSNLVKDVYAVTTQQFIFRYFLGNDHPDVVIIFLPFNHAKIMELEVSAAEMQYFHSLAKHYLPKETKIFYMPTPSEFEGSRLASVWINRTFSGLLATEMIRKLNQKLFHVLYDDLLADSQRVYYFFDLLKVSADREDWSEDGVHMHWIWYELVISMFWETFCNSVDLDAF